MPTIVKFGFVIRTAILLSLQVSMEISAYPIRHNGKASAARMHDDEIRSMTSGGSNPAQSLTMVVLKLVCDRSTHEQN